MRKRAAGGSIHPTEIWWAALWGAFQDLWEHVTRSETADELRFQNDRLLKNVRKRIEGKKAREMVLMFRCYEFVTDPARPLGFDECRRLHDEEMKAGGKDSAQLFCRTFRRKVDSSTRELRELRAGLSSRLDSIASWMEAQQGFGVWFAFRHYGSGWQSDPDARGRAVHAWILANALRFLQVYEFSDGYKVTGVRLWEGLGVGTNYEGVPWTQPQWANILEEATKLAKQGEADCSPSEQWVWWCYPVFRRYGWNSREVTDAARERFGKRPAISEPEKFRRHWMNLGLRFVGRKTGPRKPPLAEFVRHISVPDPDKMRGVPIFGLAEKVTKKS